MVTHIIYSLLTCRATKRNLYQILQVVPSKKIYILQGWANQLVAKKLWNLDSMQFLTGWLYTPLHLFLLNRPTLLWMVGVQTLSKEKFIMKQFRVIMCSLLGMAPSPRSDKFQHFYSHICYHVYSSLLSSIIFLPSTS